MTDSANTIKEETNDEVLVTKLVNSHLGMRRELCANCTLPVFLAEKFIVSRVVYHRTCFRCSHCHQQLTPGNYFKIKVDQYCCEICNFDNNSGLKLLDVPLSDEEKSKQCYFKHEKGNNKIDDKFDEVISDRTDKFASKHEQLMEKATSPDSNQGHNFYVNNLYDIVKFRRASVDEKLEKIRNQTKPTLKRSSSLKNFREYITKDHEMISEMSIRFSLIRRRLELFDSKSEFKPQEIKEVQNIKKYISIDKDDYPQGLNPFFFNNAKDQILTSEIKITKYSSNPFNNTNDDTFEERSISPKLVEKTKSQGAIEVMPTKRLLEAPQISFNPFWTDDEEPEISLISEFESRNKSIPVSKPRILRHSHVDKGMPPIKSNIINTNFYSSNTSIASSCSTPGSIYRKKKLAPLPPVSNQNLDISINTSGINTNFNNNLSPRATSITRKSKPAPAPPHTSISTSTLAQEISWAQNFSSLPNESMNLKYLDNNNIHRQYRLWNEEKLDKNEVNKNTQNALCTEASAYLYLPNKSKEGKWKRKKGPAPPRPNPLRRKIKVLSLKDVKLELDQIEMQQQGLEKQGVRLEQIIRDKCETGTISEEKNLGIDVEELILELFVLVNEKNELFRRQAELILLRRQQKLEEQHADIEYQVRCLITQPEATKTDFDKQQEETLIQRLVEIVQKRNEIIDCLEMDRKREMEEDHSIHKEMDLYVARNKTDNVNLIDEFHLSTKLKKGKIKEKKSKKSNKKDIDKDIDEFDVKLKRRGLIKWF